jgi:hypothetical protein
MRVYFADDLNVVEEDYWIFVEAADAYAAVRVVQGGYSWDDANWIRCSQLDTPVIFDAALKSDFADFEAFKTSIRSRSLSVRGGVLYYKCIDGSEIQLYLEGEFTPAIDSQLVNYNPVKVFDSPFITSDWNSGVVEISKDDRQLVINLQDCGTPSKADINGDCVVDLLDIFEIAQSWGKCSVPYAQECDNPYLN